ncbi:MAG: hypothetical protein ACLF0G_04005 [Candidatus Brocadiia bacterium]
MRPPIAILALMVLPVCARADVLHMADGTTREGKVVEVNEREVIVEFGQGSVYLRVPLPRDQVVRIERKPTAGDQLTVEYVKRLAEAMEGGANDWYALGLWCREQRVLNDKAQEAFQRALALDPDHVPAHRALGHVKLDGSWMTPERAVHLLAPDLAAAAEQAQKLEAQKRLEEAKTELLKARKRIAELQAEVEQLEEQNQQLEHKLATIPPPPPPRVIYRPIIIYRDRHGPGKPAPVGNPSGGRTNKRTPSSPGRTNKVSP